MIDALMKDGRDWLQCARRCRLFSASLRLLGRDSSLSHKITFQNRLLSEIQAEDLRALCNKVKECGAPATAVQIRDIVKQVYVYAIAHGEKVDNSADSVGAASIATSAPMPPRAERSTPSEREQRETRIRAQMEAKKAKREEMGRGRWR